MNDTLFIGMARFNFRSASSSKRRIVRMKRSYRLTSLNAAIPKQSLEWFLVEPSLTSLFVDLKTCASIAACGFVVVDAKKPVCREL